MPGPGGPRIRVLVYRSAFSRQDIAPTCYFSRHGAVARVGMHRWPGTWSSTTAVHGYVTNYYLHW